MIVLLVLAVLALVNLATAAAFAFDKMQAEAGEWRVSEGTLLMLAMIGGWPGAKWAQRHFRHKTRKQPFGRLLDRIPLLQIGVVAGLWLLVS